MVLVVCELFALSANRVVSISFTWRGFLKRGRIHCDGWGVAWYVGKGVALVKEPRPAPESPMARFLLSRIRSHLVISHVRWATQGSQSYVNTHPFVRELFGREWVFAHNGDVSGIMEEPEFKLKYYFPVGETDSEYAFCYIMDNLRELGNEINSVIRVSKVIWSLANRIGGYGKFNFLLSNGTQLFTYMNREYTLHYLLRHPPHKGYVRLCDEDFEVSLEELKAPNELAAIVATKPLTNEKWIAMEPNTLYVFEHGDLILRVDRHGKMKHTLSDVEIEVLRYVRGSPHSVKLSEIASTLGLDLSEAYMVVEKLRMKGYLKQHSRDLVEPSNPNARYYTNPNRREIIDKVILH